MSAIKLTVKKATGDYDQGRSKFLGNPTLPTGWSDTFDSSVIFLLQIRLEEIAKLDKDNLLPHKGYLYFFLDVADTEYSMKPIVKYYDGEPEELLNGFNDIVDGYEDYVNDYLVEFSECDDYDDGIKLFGKPNDWNYEGEPEKLLLQFDPIASDMGIFSHLDGFLYFFFGKEKDFSDVSLLEEIS